MTEIIESQLHIPEGINFDCTGCGNCCFEWPVPITRNDFARISKYADEQGLDNKKLFRVLNVDDDKLKVFSHSLEKREDGLCQFLTAEKRCSLHNDFGVEAKPAMCRLFPYTFTNTPSGTYASVSFAATGVLFNQGKPLVAQRELLGERFNLFNELFPNLSLAWNDAQLLDGTPLAWSDYIGAEELILEKLRAPEHGQRVEKILFEEAERFRKRAVTARLDNIAGLTTNPKIIDLVLIRNLLITYFPDNVYRSGVCDLNAQEVAKEFLAEPKKVSFRHRGADYSLPDLLGVRLGRLPDGSADLLRRFAYLRIFSKLYFGPGFNYLSVIAGIHHLAVLLCLLRIRLKLELLHRKCSKPDDSECLAILAEDTRTLERRLTVSSFGQETIAMLEILLLSPQRLERLLSVAG
jgi:Fe-S-cluster containining protein